MPIIAVDIVLLPPDSIINRAISINRKFFRPSVDSISLSKTKCLPHISLAMGCIDTRKINEVKHLLRVIAKENNFVKLIISSGFTEKPWFRIKRDSDIYALHKVIMNRLKVYFSYKATAKMFKKKAGEKINNITVNYVRSFRKKSAFTNFVPHITLGSGRASFVMPKLNFTSRKLALCHLGNFCTARKVLACYTLASNTKKD